jgi:hypothetical protein
MDDKQRTGYSRSIAMPTVPIRSSGQAQARLIARVLGVTLLVIASVCSVASQSDRFVGVHEVPPFVCDRVELAHDLAVDRSPWEPWTGEFPRWFYGPTVPGAICPPRAPLPRSYG